MMLRYSLNEPEQAERIERAVSQVLESGLRTRDIATGSANVVGTEQMGSAVVAALG
jgi:3-isopropylmalate dehydrogenase